MTEISAPLIIGFDILPHSSPSAKKTPRYAMILFRDEVLETQISIRRNELLKAIRKLEPDIVATDNLLELAPTEKGIIEFLSKISSKVRVIQVTGSPIHGMTSLKKLARKHGIEIIKHPSPIETATVLAKLAALGVGIEVSALAHETRITITRARNIGPGGYSQARYQRRMHGAIQQVSRKILEKLTKAGMDYDQYETRTSHGWSRCAIHIYKAFEIVTKLIQPEVNRIAGVAVRISPVKRRSLLYSPREEHGEHIGPRRLLIVGIDAGTTVGIAIADISAHIMAIRSGRGLSRGDVIRYLVEFGKPILIASDVSPAPSFIEKLSRSLQAYLFVPDRLMSVAEKRKLAKSFTANSELCPRNAHQRDAVAAITKVFQVYGKKLKLLNQNLRESEELHLTSKAVEMVFQGVSIRDAFEQSIISKEPKEPKIEPVCLAQPMKDTSKRERRERMIVRLQRQVESLQRQLEYIQNQHKQSLEEQKKTKQKLQQVQRQLNRALNREQREQRRDEQIQRKDAEIHRLEKKLHEQNQTLESTKRTLTNLKLMRRLEIRGEVQPVLVLPHFSQEELRHLSDRYPQKRGKVVFIQDPSGGGRSTAEQLIQFGVHLVITQGTMSHLALQQFKAAHIPVINAGSLRITVVDEFAVVDVKQLEKEITKWQDTHEASEREAAADAIKRLIEDYRQERRNE
jgi:predicted RNase H-like nuclease (RuvC/YqgF family)